ncbi:MAG: putative toxin-antitoxin system toxin component, PIN family [Chloroflexi bacterium]|nr:putative toxin-antitoxin system toxin component, PIN family [Chloroflexota bacterium]
MAAVVDTNVWVSAFLTPQGFPARLIEAGRAGRFAVVTSLPLLEELLEVLRRPRIMKVRQTTADDAEAYVRSVAAVARLVPIAGMVRLCRNPDDD